MRPSDFTSSIETLNLLMLPIGREPLLERTLLMRIEFP